MTLLIDSIRHWNLDARYETDNSFFVASKDVNIITDGSKSIIIGRKGTGKTALSKYISAANAAQIVDFNRFRYQSFFNFSNDGYSESSKYIDVWLYVIYTTALSIIESIDPYSITGNLVDPGTLSLIKATKKDPKPYLSRLFDNLGISISGSNVFGTNVNISVKENSFSPAKLRNTNANLEKCIGSFVEGFNKNLYVMIDDLDQDLGNKKSDKKEYQNLISSLLYAIAYLRMSMPKFRVTAYMREDIFFDLPESTKWMDLRLRLQWTRSRLREFLICKIRQSCDDPPDDEEELLSKIFTSSTTTSGSGKKLKIVDNIISYSQNRPRDVMGYLKLCAELSSDSKKSRLTQEDLSEHLRDYADFIAEGVKEELSWYYNNVEQIYDSITECGHPRFKYTDLSSNIKRLCDVDEREAFGIVNHLHRYGLLGNHYNNSEIFSFTDPQLKLNIDRSIIVHRGVQKRFGM